MAMPEIIQPEKQKFLKVFVVNLEQAPEQIQEDMETKLNQMWDNGRGIERVVGSPKLLIVVTAPRTNPNNILPAIPLPGNFKTQ